MNNAIFNRKLTTFRSRMQSIIAVSESEMIIDPMGTGIYIKGDIIITSDYKCRLVRTKSTDENYTDGGAGFIPDSFKWILTLDKIQEDSTFTLLGKNYITGKWEELIYQNKIYGYRIPVRVRN